MRRVLIIGSATIDTVRQAASAVRKMGGVPVYGGLTFAAQGVETILLTNVGPDMERLRELCRRSGVHLDASASAATTTFVDHVDGDQRWQELQAVAEPLTWEQVARAAEGVDHVHLGPVHPNDMAGDVWCNIGSLGASISLDIQGLVRSGGLGRMQVTVSHHLWEALAAADYVKASHDELAAVRSVRGIGGPELVQEFHIRELVVTDGSRGGEVLLTSGERMTYQAVRVATVSDPTGAGDVFFAAYLETRLHLKRSVAESCTAAAMAASEHVAGHHLEDDWLLLSD